MNFILPEKGQKGDNGDISRYPMDKFGPCLKENRTRDGYEIMRIYPQNMPIDFKEKHGELPALAPGYQSNHRFVPVRQELVFYNGQRITLGANPWLKHLPVISKTNFPGLVAFQSRISGTCASSIHLMRNTQNSNHWLEKSVLGTFREF